MSINYTYLDAGACDFIEVAPDVDLVDGGRLFVEIDDFRVVIFRVAGQLFAIEDLCSHDDGPLGDGELIGYDITCPRHGARFDIRTGKVKSLPAIVDIPAYPVRVNNGQIEIGLPKL